MNGSFLDISFWQDFLSNSLATILGAMLGIPIALSLDRKVSKQRETEEELKKSEVALERKRKVLSLLRAELDTNKQYLGHLIEKQTDQPSIAILVGMKQVLWEAFLDSGELYWIDNPSLINKVSFAYYSINALAMLEHRYADPNFRMKVSDSSGKSTFAGERVVKDVQSLRPDALVEIIEAIQAIDTELDA